MHWTSNAKIFNLNESQIWDSYEAFKNSQNQKMLITITDESMYDRYQPNDTVQITISENPPSGSDCLILMNDEVSFRQVTEDPEEESTVTISRYFPQRSSKINKEDIKILGYATGILRT